jgi:glutamate formiminotransferase / 5-formyltetrahydrofolate cyclo-ligase
MSSRTLLGVPNVSEGRDRHTIAAIAAAVRADGNGAIESESESVRLLDLHSDADHNRSVLSFAGTPRAVAGATFRCAREAVELIDLHTADPPGQHPHVGALDVAPLVYPAEAARGAACAWTLALADRIASELHVPVFLYGELTASGSQRPRTRAELRRGGIAELSRRMALPAGDGASLRPDFGPRAPHPSAGATLLAARPPLVAFNLQLARPASVADARRIASLVREGGAEGLPGVRAIAVQLSGGAAQVSTNVERPFELPLAAVVAAVSRHASVASAELVGLVPGAAMEGFPEDLPTPGFEPGRQLLENALVS